MSNNNKLRTTFECLPIEIFLEIFALLPLREIVAAFSGLNSYINSTIRSTRGLSHVVKYNKANFIDLANLFPIQISRLVIVHAEMVDFRLLINLRSLTLKYGTNTQFDSIRPQHFPMLEILHLYAGRHINLNDNTNTINDLFEVILSNGFPRLRICTADRIGLLDSSETWTGSPALHSLHLDMKTEQDYERLLSACPNLRRFTSSSPLWSTLHREVYRGPRIRRILNDINKLKQLESEGIFILDVNPLGLMNNAEPPPVFSNTTTMETFIKKDINIIYGRILPKTEPYCRASFLIKIMLPASYPFGIPQLRFIDPIYHPNVEESGNHCCCWHIAGPQSWRPTTWLADLIKAVISIIDQVPDREHTTRWDCMEEYLNNRGKFNENALKHTLSHGRPRY